MYHEIPTGEVKFRVSKTSIVRGSIAIEDKRIILTSGWSTYLKDEFKAMEGARWLGGNMEPRPRKAWGVANSIRNRFQLLYLLGGDPYKPYEGKLPDFFPRRKKASGESVPFNHQLEMTSHILNRRQCIIACEMGTGKTLAAIEAMEQSGIIADLCLWVGPNSALDSVKYEFYNWRVCEICGKLGRHHKYENHQLVDYKSILPRFMTYEGLKKMIETWTAGSPAYKLVIMDECSRVKTPTSQRSQAALHLANSMRDEYGQDAIIALMSGSPAPKDPSDWWHLCEIACPGFIREGSQQKFKYRLAKIEQYESQITGGSFPKLVTWWDDENKCQVCGKFEDDPNHHPINKTESWYHKFTKSVNEVALLYRRMQGLTLVKFKKDCLDLPEKVYKRHVCKPTPSVLRAANLITKSASSTIRGLTLLRELSDGFQYQEVESGTKRCPECEGRLIISRTVDKNDPHNPLDAESLERGHRALWNQDDEGGYFITGYKDEPLELEIQEIRCDVCKGTGQVPNFIRDVARVDCPKDQAVVDYLDQYEEEGRIVLWAGFTESIERVTQLCIKHGWPVVRLDGRGWWTDKLGTTNGLEILSAFDDKQTHPKIAFIGQPGAGGMGLNLTASSVEIYYSNTFKYEDRAQSEDRIHRPGADHNRGCTIIDIIHLPQDLWVLENLKKKRDLQAMTMGMLNDASREFEKELQLQWAS